jgi:hypothetical protein
VGVVVSIDEAALGKAVDELGGGGATDAGFRGDGGGGGVLDAGEVDEGEEVGDPGDLGFAGGLEGCFDGGGGPGVRVGFGVRVPLPPALLSREGAGGSGELERVWRVISTRGRSASLERVERASLGSWRSSMPRASAMPSR